jgi:hypothetical protein
LKIKLLLFRVKIVADVQSGFCKGRSCAGGYFPCNVLIEKCREFSLETHIAFIDTKKDFSRTSKNITV